MDINEILKGVNCECGKHHTCSIEKVYIEHGAIAHLTQLCEEYTNILVVADENTFAAAGKQTLKALEGKNIKEVIFSGKTVLIPDEKAIEKVTEKKMGL